MKVVASYTEDQLITSDPRQLLEIEEAKREFEESQQEEMYRQQEIAAQADNIRKGMGIAETEADEDLGDEFDSEEPEG
jgi:hypothetical protein